MHNAFIVVGASVLATAACTSHPLLRNPGHDAEASEVRDGEDAAAGFDGAVLPPLEVGAEAVLLVADVADEATLDLGSDARDAAWGDEPLPRDVPSEPMPPDTRPGDLAPPAPTPIDATSPCSPSAGFLLCDDFSSPTPEVPRQPSGWPNMTGMTVTLAPNEAVIEDPGTWSSSYVQWGTTMDYRDTSLEVDMTATTSERSLSYVIWGAPPTYVSLGLQRDEGRMYLHFVVNDAIVARLSGKAKVVVNQAQRVAMELRADGELCGLVDGEVDLTTTIDLSKLPATLAPGIGANAYPSQTFTFDNLLVRRLPKE